MAWDKCERGLPAWPFIVATVFLGWFGLPAYLVAC